MEFKFCFQIVLMCCIFAGAVCHVAIELKELQDEVLRSKRSNDEGHCTFQEHKYPRDCKEVYEHCESGTVDGVFLIKPDGSEQPFEVYCQNSVDGGGWTVLQRRMDGSVEFYREWEDYKNGFGFLHREFWLGNDKISIMTNQKDYELRIDVTDTHDDRYYVKYSLFRISDERSKYKLVGIGDHFGSRNTSMAWHKNKLFSTRDQDNDGWNSFDCAKQHRGAWWFGEKLINIVDTRCSEDEMFCERFPVGNGCAECADLNLNGVFDGEARGTSIFWEDLKGTDNNCGLKYTDMKIRPAPL